MNVLSCIAKTPTPDGKVYYSVALEKADGTQIGAFAFEAVNPGDQVDDARIIPGKREGEWTLKSAPKAGGKSWQAKDEALIVAESALKAVIELTIAGKINPVKVEDYTINTINFVKVIMAGAAFYKGQAPATSAAPAPAAKAPPKPDTDFDGLHQEPNMVDLENMDWSKETQKAFLDTLVIVARHLKWEPQNVKTFLVEKFHVADSRGITIAMRNDVMKALIAEVKL